MILVKDFSTFGNHNLTWESPQIFTRWSRTPDKGIGTLSAKCATQEVVDDFHLSGNKEGSQTDVLIKPETPYLHKGCSLFLSHLESLKHRI